MNQPGIPMMNPYMQQYMQMLQQLAGTINPMAQQAAVQQQPAPQPMTPEVIHADIVPVDRAEEVDRFSVGNGQSQMFMARDDSVIYIKTGSQTGSTIVCYDRRPPEKKRPEDEFVTRADLEEALLALKPARKARKEETDNEPA